MRRLLTGLLVAAALLAGPALAAPPAAALQQLAAPRLAGQGVFTWFGLSIYQAELWVGANGYVAAAPGAAPFLLDLRYARDLAGKKIAEASYDEMKKLGAGSEAQRQAWLVKMTALFPDVKEGTHLSGLYLPGFGARFYLDGAMLGEVADADFGAAFFAIWLAPDTSAKKLRLALLADAAPRP